MSEPDVNSTASAHFIVAPSDLASALNLEPEDAFPPVFATSRMVALMELAAARLLRPHLRPGELSVGVTLDVVHTAATPPRRHRLGHGEIPRARGEALRLRDPGHRRRGRDRPLHAQARGRHDREARRGRGSPRREGLTPVDDVRNPRAAPGIPLDRAASRRRAVDRVPARGPRMCRDVAGLSRPPGRRDRLRRPRLQPDGLRRVRPRERDAAGPLHARRGAGRAPRRPRALQARERRPFRAQRRRIDRAHPCGRPSELRPRADRRGAARLRGARQHRRDHAHHGGLRDDAPERAARPASRQQHRFDVPGVVRRVAQPRVPGVEHRGVPAGHRVPRARRAGRRRPVRHHQAGRRRRGLRSGVRPNLSCFRIAATPRTRSGRTRSSRRRPGFIRKGTSTSGR